VGGLADSGSPAAWLDLTVGVGLVAAGFLAWWRRPASTTGLWIWLASSLWLVAYPYPAASLWHRVPLVVAVLTFPATGRSPTAVVPIIIVAALAVATPSGQNGALAGVAAVLLVALLGFRLTRARSTGQIRAAYQALGTGSLLAAAFLVGPLLRLVDPIAAPAASAPVAYALLTGAAAGWLAVATVRDDDETDALRLIVDVGREAPAMPSRVGRLVGDPRIQIGIWLVELRAYIDVDGHPISLTAQRRGVTRMNDADGLPAAVLVHDPRIAIDPRLAPAITTIARLSASTARAQNSARARVRLLEDSRLRLVGSTDVERRRVAAELQASVRPLLDAARAHLRDALDAAPPASRSEIERLSREVAGATQELFRLARGTLPRTLVQHGLAEALREAADRSPVPTTVAVTAPALGPLLESTVYFVTVEALGNAIKHANASRISVVVTCDEHAVSVTVSDDGQGIRLTPESASTGLRGMRDRVEALGGSMHVQSETGTTLRAVVPLSPPVTGSASTA